MNGEIIPTNKKKRKENLMQTFFGLQFMRLYLMELKMSSQIVENEQPNYLNTLLLIKSNSFPKPSNKKAKLLLKELKKLERFFGREKTPKSKKWLSRCLDLDILWWEDFHMVDEELTLPHPRFMNRNFVITPLSEILSRTQKIKKFDDPKWSIE